MQLSTHFSLEELTRTDTGLPNDPDMESGANLVRLADQLLEPARALLGVPLRTNSGYRSPAVNTAVKGSGWKKGQKPSAHLEGRAADLVPEGLDLDEAFNRVRASDLPFDKILIETMRHGDGRIARWLHLQIAKLGAKPRRMALRALVDAHGNASYQEVRG